MNSSLYRSVVAAAAAIAGTWAVRRASLRWGAEAGELTMLLPGGGWLPAPDLQATHAITINAPSAARRPDRHDRRRWILAVSVGEGIGFALATTLAILGLVAEIDGPGRLALAMVGGALEGAALASGQYLGMRAGRPPAGRWIGATALAAALAWGLGMMPSTLGMDLGEPVSLIALGGGGIVLLASIPVAQWLVLARPGAFRWVPVNAGAWLAAILWTFAPSPFIDERSPIIVVAALYVTAGVLMAVTFASLTAGVAGSLFLPGATHRVGRGAGRTPGD